MSTSTPPPPPLSPDEIGDINDPDDIDDRKVDQLVSNGVQKTVVLQKDYVRYNCKSTEVEDSSESVEEIFASRVLRNSRAATDANVNHENVVGTGIEATKKPMTQHARVVDISSLRTFTGLASLASLAFIALFVSLFLSNDLATSITAILLVLLSLSAAGFAKLWHELGQY